MLNHTMVGLFAGLVALVAAPHSALAQDAIAAPAQKTIGSPKGEMIPSLAVINSHGASLQGNALTMTGVSASAAIPRASGANEERFFGSESFALAGAPTSSE